LLWLFSSIPTSLVDISTKDIYDHYGSVAAAKRKAQEAPTVKIQNTRLKKHHDGLVEDVEEGEEINGWTKLSGAIA
jgi:hypothetical protein